MKSAMRSLAAALAVLLLAGLAPSAAPAVDVYLKKLSRPSWDGALVTDIDDAGRAVGSYYSGGSFRGFFYNGSTYSDVHPPGWINSNAYARNGSGQIVGFGDPGGGDDRGFLYSGGGYTTVHPPGWTSTNATALSGNGLVVGHGDDGSGDFKGFLFDGVGYQTILPFGCSHSIAKSVNNNGVIVGLALCGGGNSTAFRFQSGVYSDLYPPGWDDTDAIRISSGGDVLGNGSSGGTSQCYLYRGGTYKAILPPGMATAWCVDFNSNLDVVGIAANLGGTRTMFIYRGGAYYLFDVADYFFLPFSLNSKLMVAGFGESPLVLADALIAYLLPEPDLTSAGRDGPVSIAPGAPLGLQGSVKAFSFVGRPSDWWLFAQTPTNTFSYSVSARGWRPGFFRSAGLPLRDVGPLNLPSAGGAPGVYMYFLGADLKRNGAFDTRYLSYDILTVIQR